jgi:trigger factor
MSEQNKKYKNLDIQNEDGKITIQAEIPKEEIEKYKKEVIEDAQKTMEKPGFRKGNVPLEMVEQELGMEKVVGAAADRALNEAYPEIIKENNLQIMSAPKVSITKFALGDDLGFKAEVAVVPEFKLPNYKKIGEKIGKTNKDKKINVSEDEINDVINQILKMHTKVKQDSNEESKIVNKDGNPIKSETEQPELNDEFVKSIGKFENVEDFKSKIKENLETEKKMAEIRKTREEIADELVKATELKIPEIALEGEIQGLKHRLQHDLEHQNMTMDEYFKKINSTEEDFFKEQKNHIEKQLKTKIILEKIADEENIKPAKEKIELQAQMLKQRYPNTDEDSLKAYVKMILKNEEVLQILEGSKGEEKEEK